MTYPKFIITKDGHFRLGMVNLHMHLLEHGDYCLGAVSTSFLAIIYRHQETIRCYTYRFGEILKREAYFCKRNLILVANEKEIETVKQHEAGNRKFRVFSQCDEG